MSRKTKRNAGRNAAKRAPGNLFSPGFRPACGRIGLTGLALGSLACASPLFAADAPPDAKPVKLQEVVVTGLRQSLKNAQDLKMESPVIQDSISAQDIGALPDQSVTETLQRIPGVAIDQFAAGVDPDHFSVEGSGIVVRGLESLTRSELNGRDTFSANNGRSISFADIPPEMLIGVDVIKSPSANMIEGGIAGTVNLRTRVPFDSRGQVVAFDAGENYADFVKKWRPNFSGLYSNRWSTGIGDVGFLVNFVNSRLASRADGTQASNFGCRTNLTDSSGNPITSPAVTCPNGQQGIFFPRGAAFRSQDFERQREGQGGALQWKSPDDSMLATLQFLRTDSTEAWTEHAEEIATDNVTANPTDSYPVPGTTFGVAPSGVFTNGLISTTLGWRSDQISSLDTAHRTPINGLQSNDIDRSIFQKYITQDVSFDFKWNINDRWGAKLDLQHVGSTVHDNDNGIWGSTFQDANIQLQGNNPPIDTFVPVYNVNTPGAPCTIPATSGNCSNFFEPGHASYSDPYNSYWRSAMDHIEASDGWERAAQLDFDYKINDGWARSLQFGPRWSDRNETTRFSTYNWGVMSEIWGNNGPIWMDSTPNQVAPYPFTNFFQGQVPNPIGNQPRPYYTGNTLSPQYLSFAESVVNDWLVQGGGKPISGCAPSGASGWVPLADRCGVIPGTPFLPGEVNPVDERNKAAYVMLNFGHSIGSHTLSGNIGVRYTATSRTAEGFLSFPNGGLTTAAQCAAVPPGQTPPLFCQYPAAYQNQVRAWANGANYARNTVEDYRYWLPSLNLMYELRSDLLLRFALSKDVTPPDIGYVRGDYTLGFGPNFILTDANGKPTTLEGSSTMGNPNLRPEQADSADLSLEWYFAPVGDLTGALFYKRLTDVVVNNTTLQNFTNAGLTLPIIVTQPGNSPTVGKVEGAEIGYQQAYDFLPKPFDGLGLSFNYTYLHSSGVKQSTLSDTDPTVGAGLVANIDTSLLPLQGLSKETYNVTLFYSKYGVDARVAWNWRSAFLLTTRDVIVPYAPIMNENSGTLDGSIFYDITPQIKVGIQGANLLDNIVRTSQVLDNNLLRTGRSWFITDRRISLIVRAMFQ
ncbi:MAG TPA: TonB-dependent receptor [Steroidobacteraceae bacterium]|nr:TonB-dependent receptor [Steroidobacteraceae bacterium]